MNNRKTRLTDLPYDILRLIMMMVAQSPNGAATFAWAVSSCRTLKEFAADADILKVVEFENVRLFGIHESFWDENSLLQKCWDAGNERAYNVIWIKIIDVGAFEHMTASSKYVLVRIKDIVRVGDGFRFSNLRRIANIPFPNSNMQKKKEKLKRDEVTIFLNGLAGLPPSSTPYSLQVPTDIHVLNLTQLTW